MNFSSFKPMKYVSSRVDFLESISTSALAGDESWRATPALASFDIKLMISTMKHFFVSFPNLDDVFFAVHANAVNQLDEKKKWLDKRMMNL